MPVLRLLIAAAWLTSLAVAQDAASDLAAPEARQGIRPIGRDDAIRIMATTVNNGVTRVMIGDQIQIYFRIAGLVPTEMRISETSGQFPESWAAWVPFAPHPGGPLTPGMSYVFLPSPNRSMQNELPRKTFYLQFRRDGRVSNIGTATVDVYKKHVISGSAVVEEARLHGFVFLKVTNNSLPPLPPIGVAAPDLGCKMASAPAAGRYEFRGPANSSVGGCLFEIFTARNLNAPWAFDSWQWNRSMLGVCEASVSRSTNSPSSLAASVRLQFAKGTFQDLALSCTYLLTSVTLIGPAGTPWRQAFTR